ncbi:hypothetical protein QN345_07405 [Cryobacterium sp. 10I1]|uniref:hypothetical protein n=1 Tax=unclassified Cryobacterium TaxID=2649013 RepID=UPI002AC9E591|nr:MULTISPECIES: hypothetical protein [unclassified Cryobacterium]MEB0002665.1 hypothetical protein [Cryobacterium sp. RTC2.1]MEB0201061.1 hypothetical protein [Cryobacterium sp. 5I3]MEB0286675.1 hypothetical protein [Cryobacterium sp. 10S3]MEB0305143.1 hypothetical protein [Cryobacterium sp. 10I1]WPX14237.1 hypothetical protein RHM57_02355 [Cryobacterium sp. 10S3]
MSTRGVTVQPERGIRRPARRAVTEAGPLEEHGRQERQDRRRSFRRPERTVKTTRANQSGLGGRHLGIGLSVAGGIVAAYLFWEYVEQWPRYTTPVPTPVAWVILVAATAFAIAVVQRLSARMPDWLFAAALASGAVVIALDLAGSHAGADRGVFPTAAAAVGSLLIALVTVRRGRDVVSSTAVLGTLLAVFAITEPRSDPLSFAPELVAFGLAVIPPLLGVAIVRSFHRMVQRELDLVLVQSTVSQPRFAVGMLASEELARIDLDAETLLDDVSKGRTALPLNAAKSTTASSLATQLRLHLIQGRRETWLYHAITESEFLGPSVSLNDPAGLAGLLDPAQRDALLRTIWLLISDTQRPEASVALSLGPIRPTNGLIDRQKLRFPIELATTGVPRRRVDPETWQAIRVVGPHIASSRGGSLHVEIECSIDNPADA